MLGFVGQKWEQHIVAELDSALNKWIDSVPDHCECFPFAQLSVRGQKFCAALPASPMHHFILRSFRTFCLSTMFLNADCVTCGRSTLGPQPTEQLVPQPIRLPLRKLLPSPDLRPPAVHPLPAQALHPHIPVTRNMHQRSPVMHTRPRRAVHTRWRELGLEHGECTSFRCVRVFRVS